MNIKEKIYHALLDQELPHVMEPHKDIGMFYAMATAKLPKSVGDRLSSADLPNHLRKDLVYNKFLSPEAIHNVVVAGNKDVHRAASHNENLPEHTFDHIVKNISPNEETDAYSTTGILLRNKNLPEKHQDHLISKVHNVDMMSIAKHTKNQSVIRKLSKGPFVRTRMAVANNEHTPVSLKEKMMDDQVAEVRQEAIKDRNHDPEFLHKHIHDEDPAVRIQIAKHPNVKSETLHALSSDPSVRVRREVADNGRTPMETLHTMMKDESHMVRNTAVANTTYRKYK